MTSCFPHLRALAAGLLLFAAAGAPAEAPPSAADAVLSLQAAYATAVPAGEQAERFRALIPVVIDRVRRSYASEVDVPAFAGAARHAIESLPQAASAQPAEVFRLAINSALRGLDPYSRYLDARMAAYERDVSRGSFVGVGLQVEAAEGGVRVLAPMRGGPAERAGLRAGDVIVRVDGQPLAGVALADAVAMMRGDPGTTVALTLRRSGVAGEVEVALTRETIRNPPVAWSLDGGVLVLRINAFGVQAAAAVQRAIAEAGAAQPLQAVVLDLRGNPGGLVNEAVRIADTFLSHGDIVFLRGRSPGDQRSWHADAAELLAGVPMVVLIDARSASASELLAAALQDNGRAIVMGQRSYGKGSVQTTYPLGREGGALKLTSALYYRPSGAAVQRVGVAPDIALAPATRDTRIGADAEPHVEPARCRAVHPSQEADVACAIVYLQAGSAPAFLARLPELGR